MQRWSAVDRCRPRSTPDKSLFIWNAKAGLRIELRPVPGMQSHVDGCLLCKKSFLGQRTNIANHADIDMLSNVVTRLKKREQPILEFTCVPAATMPLYMRHHTDLDTMVNKCIRSILLSGDLVLLHLHYHVHR